MRMVGLDMTGDSSNDVIRLAPFQSRLSRRWWLVALGSSQLKSRQKGRLFWQLRGTGLYGPDWLTWVTCQSLNQSLWLVIGLSHWPGECSVQNTPLNPLGSCGLVIWWGDPPRENQHAANPKQKNEYRSNKNTSLLLSFQTRVNNSASSTSIRQVTSILFPWLFCVQNGAGHWNPAGLLPGQLLMQT